MVAIQLKNMISCDVLLAVYEKKVQNTK